MAKALTKDAKVDKKMTVLILAQIHQALEVAYKDGLIDRVYTSPKIVSELATINVAVGIQGSDRAIHFYITPPDAEKTPEIDLRRDTPPEPPDPESRLVQICRYISSKHDLHTNGEGELIVPRVLVGMTNSTRYMISSISSLMVEHMILLQRSGNQAETTRMLELTRTS